MQIKPSSGGQGIIDHAYWRVGANTTKYPTNDAIRAANIWYRQIWGWIWESAGNWTPDDINATTLPVMTTTLVDGQRDYSFPVEAGTEYGEIERVEVLDSDGNYYPLSKVEKNKIPLAISEYRKTKGKPVEYYLEANSISTLPAADTTMVTAAAGLKIYLSRDIDEFTTADTTQEPGFHRNWHVGVGLGIALEYAARFLPELVIQLETELGVNPRIQIPHGLKREIQAYYRRRNYKDNRVTRRVLRESYS
jgi:hypothetical protein